MIKHCDIISIHCPYTPETFHLLSKKRLKLLKRNCIVINTSRGEIIDEQALASLLFKKKIGGAGLDVFEHEPEITQKLLESDNVILLPHISSATIESRIAMGGRVIKNIISFANGKTPPDVMKKLSSRLDFINDKLRKFLFFSILILFISSFIVSNKISSLKLLLSLRI